MRKIRQIITSILAVCMVLSMTSCGNASNPKKENVSIVDINSDEVTIPAEVNKVICRSGNGTSFMVAMGYADKLVGTADYVVTNPWADVFAEGVTSLATFGWAPSSEEVYSVDADLVMIADPEVAGNLRKDGINSICYKQYNEQEILDSARLMGTIFGPDAAKYADNWIEYYNKTDELIDKALKDVSEDAKPVVYYIYGSSNKGVGRTAGGGSIEQFWIEDAGGVFATPDLPNDGPKITAEEAIARNPEVIFIGGIHSYNLERELLSSAEWSDVPAVSNKRIYNIPIGFTAWDFYGVEFPLLKLWAAKQMCPDLVDVNMHEITKDFYKVFYGKEFSDSEIDYILEGRAPDGTEFIKE